MRTAENASPTPGRAMPAAAKAPAWWRTHATWRLLLGLWMLIAGPLAAQAAGLPPCHAHAAATLDANADAPPVAPAVADLPVPMAAAAAPLVHRAAPAPQALASALPASRPCACTGAPRCHCAATLSAASLWPSATRLAHDGAWPSHPVHAASARRLPRLAFETGGPLRPPRLPRPRTQA